MIYKVQNFLVLISILIKLAFTLVIFVSLACIFVLFFANIYFNFMIIFVCNESNHVAYKINS